MVQKPGGSDPRETLPAGLHLKKRVLLSATLVFCSGLERTKTVGNTTVATHAPERDQCKTKISKARACVHDGGRLDWG